MPKTLKVLLGCGLLVVIAALLATALGGGMLAWLSFTPEGDSPLLTEAVEVKRTVAPDALLYSRDGKILLLSPGATEMELGSGQDPVLSPDGRLAAWYDDNVIICRELGGSTRQSALTSTADKPLALAWSPDGATLAAVLFAEDGKGNLLALAPGGTVRTIYGGAGMLFAPAWLPDGQSLVVHDMQNLIRVDLDGKVLATTPLANFTGNTESITSTDVYRYCPTDSGLLVFTRLVPPSPLQLQAHDGEPNTAIFLYDFRTRRATRLSGENMLAMNPQWTADGTKIRFTGYPDTDLAGNPFRVYEMQRDGSSVRELARGEIF